MGGGAASLVSAAAVAVADSDSDSFLTSAEASDETEAFFSFFCQLQSLYFFVRSNFGRAGSAGAGSIGIRAC